MKKTIYTALLALAGLLVTANAYAQQDPTRIGAGQLPYIMIILDTSGSMEWTDQGDERYPERTGPNSEWIPGTPMEIDPDDPSDGPSRFGSCFVWEPNDCDDYRRPGWKFNSDLPSWGWDLINSGGQGHLLNRWNRIRGDTHADRIRLDPASQPRHVTMKEVLTGDMVLWSKQHLDADQFPLDPTFGPGCWFVPRQRGASIQPEADQRYCEGEDRFEDLPDHDEPRPHFQEVFDTQLDNGLLDVLGTTAIFAVGLLDGYREDMSDWPNDLNDDMPGSAPGSTVGVRGAGSEDDSSHYDLGLYQVIGPKKLDIPNSYLAEISRHVQVALVDSGYLHRSDNDPWKLTMEKKNKNKGGGIQGRSELGLFYSGGADDYLDEVDIGKQPIARATALAAAVMDARQYLNNDDRFTDDPYRECRPKQIVIVTDGYPEPEVAGGAGTGLGNDALSPAFGYTDLTKYNYATTEQEIQDMVLPGMGDPRFMTRVHVVALDSGADAATQARIADKMSQMAIDGQTCAEYALGPDWLPAPHGTCNPATRACLVGGQRSYATYEPPDLDGASVLCRYPALIMSRNDRDAIQEALASVLGSIVGGAGVASRTRAVVSDFLDDDSLLGGGQYRVYSGSRIQGSAFWRGILTRETLPCDTSIANSYNEGVGITDDSGLLSNNLHADVGEQVKCGPAVDGDCSVTKADNRRIFTSIPAESLWNFTSDMYGGAVSFDSGHPLYNFRYDLMSVPEAKDEFRVTTIPSPLLNDEKTIGTRIPLYAADIQEALDEVGVWNADGLLEYFAVADGSDLVRLFDVHRGRTLSKATGNRDTSRVITGILNSTPVVVPPPIRDLPIESYRLFRARYGDRPTMMYSATLDGQLHAIHVGELEGRIAVRDFVEDNSWAASEDVVRTTASASPNGTDPHQREAWAFIPNMILRQLGSNTISQPYWMDGTPVVKDVRLCQADPERNSNEQACLAVRETAADASQFLTGDQQWRTVLVQGLGEAGSGYFALDVTRPGGLRAGASSRTVDRPDPIALWELDPTWEGSQAKALLGRSVASDKERIAGPDDMVNSYIDASVSECDSANRIWASSFMGTSVSTPEIATVVVEYVDSGTTIMEQRPVAVFGGGMPNGEVCGISNGSAVYVVDLQTGTILRRFVSYFRTGGDVTEYSFFNDDVGFTGSPSLYDSNTGAVATRGYIGDTKGRLFKIDMTNPRPENWRMVLAIDPYTNPSLMTAVGANTLGPAAGKPSIAVGPSRELIVTYGLGEPGDTTTAGQLQAVVTFAETGPESFLIHWFRIFEEGEKMTGDPLVFNRTIYFPTYAVPPGDACAPGAARIYGVEYVNDPPGGSPTGVFDAADPDFAGNPDVTIGGGGLYFELEETLIRGLTITLGPICTGRGIGDATTDLDDSRYAVAQPQLIAQTGAVPAGGMSSRHKASAGADAIGRITHNLQRRRGPVVPLNWSLIY